MNGSVFNFDSISMMRSDYMIGGWRSLLRF